jgi:anti-sigma factor RsiW
MYPVGDEDLELLEAYLDDALAEDEVQHLRDRLATEPAMANALKLLRQERASRQAYFASIDPTPAEVDKLVGSIKRQALRRRWFANPRRLLQTAAAMAACVVIGAMMGQLYRAHPGGQVAPTGNTVHVVPAGQDGKQKYAVEVTDAFGNVIAVQYFNDPREAREFQQDLKKVQQQQRQRNGVIQVGDEF